MSDQESGEHDRGDHLNLALTPTDEATPKDQNDMTRLGKTQEFKRNFRFLSTLGFTCTLMATWESILLTANLGLVNGGPAGMVYIYIGSFIGFLASVVSMAEMASLSPTSGGQYHWVSEFASPRYQKFLSYITGLLSVLGWQGAFASICFLCGTTIQAFLYLNHPTYVGQRWHGTLLTFAIAVVSTFVNTYTAGYLPSLERLILIFHIFGFIATLIPLWVLAGRTPADVVFTQFSNAGGWPSLGLSVVIGQVGPIFSFLGPDSAAHMAEEIRDASMIVPWCMLTTALLNGSLGFLILITFLFTMGDLATVLEPPTGFSFISGYLNATGSIRTTSGLASILLILEVCSAISILATSSRQTFAFGRDRALPFSGFFAHINPNSKIPVNAVLSSALFTILLSLINIGSTAAFNAIASLTVGSLFLSYVICIGCFIYRRTLPAPLPQARFSLGKYGMAINVFSFCYLCFALIFTFFPGTAKVTPESMNWSILVLGTVVIFSVGQYILHGRHAYQAPVALIQKSPQPSRASA